MITGRDFRMFCRSAAYKHRGRRLYSADEVDRQPDSKKLDAGTSDALRALMSLRGCGRYSVMIENEGDEPVKYRNAVIWELLDRKYTTLTKLYLILSTSQYRIMILSIASLIQLLTCLDSAFCLVYILPKMGFISPHYFLPVARRERR